MVRGRTLLYGFAGLAVAYLALTLLLPPDPATLKRYDLSPSALRLLQASVALPLIGIWFAAFYGYGRLRRYSDTIKASPEGPAVASVANGIMVLALGQPIQSILSAALRYAGRLDNSVEAAARIVSNYTTLLIALTAFVLICVGVRRLTELKQQRPSNYAIHGHIIVFAVLSVSYTYFVLHFAFLDSGSTAKAYHMPLWLVLLTIVVPYLYTWFVGLYAAYMMYLYNRGLKGVIYRKSWSWLSAGLAAIILSSVLVQYLMTLSAQLDQLSITAILLVIYGLLAVMAAGYLLVAFGAKRLQKIEEV